MDQQSRREFLADVGKGMVAASVGAGLAADLGFSTAFADEERARLTFGALEPLVSLMQETPAARLLPEITRRLRDGTSLRDVVAAAALASSDEPGKSKASRKRAVAAAMREVAEYLGNTPAIARNSYVDPRVIDLYEDGVTIETAVRRRYDSVEKQQAAYERAVRRMLTG